MAKFLVCNISWDTSDGIYEEGNTNILPEELNLPKEILINTEYVDIEDDEDMDEVENAISNYLSDEYGFCHFGFSFKKT